MWDKICFSLWLDNGYFAQYCHARSPSQLLTQIKAVSELKQCAYFPVRSETGHEKFQILVGKIIKGTISKLPACIHNSIYAR